MLDRGTSSPTRAFQIGALVFWLFFHTPPPTAFVIPMAIPTAAPITTAANMILTQIRWVLLKRAIHPQSMYLPLSRRMAFFFIFKS